MMNYAKAELCEPQATLQPKEGVASYGIQNGQEPLKTRHELQQLWIWFLVDMTGRTNTTALYLKEGKQCQAYFRVLTTTNYDETMTQCRNYQNKVVTDDVQVLEWTITVTACN